MTNEDLKKKILTIVRGAMLEADELPFIETTDNIADALIAAGIGDVKEAERKAFVYSEEIVHLDKKLKETEHRAARAEKAFFRLVHEMYEQDIRPMCDEKFFIESRLKDAEKELAEEGKDE